MQIERNVVEQSSIPDPRGAVRCIPCVEWGLFDSWLAVVPHDNIDAASMQTGAPKLLYHLY